MGSGPSTRSIKVYFLSNNAIYMYASFSAVYPSYSFPSDMSIIDFDYWKKALPSGSVVQLSLSADDIIEKIDNVDVRGVANRKGPVSATLSLNLHDGNIKHACFLINNETQIRLTELLRSISEVNEASEMIEYLNLDRGG